VQPRSPSIVASKPTKDFDERTGNVAQSADRFVGAGLRGAEGTGDAIAMQI